MAVDSIFAKTYVSEWKYTEKNEYFKWIKITKIYIIFTKVSFNSYANSLLPWVIHNNNFYFYDKISSFVYIFYSESSVTKYVTTERMCTKLFQYKKGFLFWWHWKKEDLLISKLFPNFKNSAFCVPC